MQEDIVGNSRTMLLLLLGAVGLVLLIACANVGNLLFTRALSRRKEIAIRSALGAGRGRVFQQLLTEALLLAGAGGALGLLLAYGTLTSASTLLAAQVPRAEEISIDGRVLLFALGMSMLSGILAGTLPAVRAGRSGLNDALKEGGRSDGAIGVRTRRLLIVCEVALSLVLLMGAGVMIQSLLALRSGDTGFDPNNVLTMRVRLVEARYPTPGQRSAFVAAALQRIRALPGVTAAGTIDDLPFSAGGAAQILGLEGQGPRRDAGGVQVRQISPATCAPWGFRCCVDATLLDSDTDVLLISQEAAKLYWGADDAIGRRAKLPACRGRCIVRWLESWGTSSSGTLLKAPRPRCTSTRPTSMPRRRSPSDISAARHARSACRCSDPRDRSGAAGRRCPDDGAGARPGTDAAALQCAATWSLCRSRAAARAVGIYSVLSHIVRGRSREIGLRTALGAQRADVLRLVIVEGMSPALVGIAAGTIAAIASAKVMESLVFGVSASDPLTLAAVGPRWRLSR